MSEINYPSPNLNSLQCLALAFLQSQASTQNSLPGTFLTDYEVCRFLKKYIRSVYFLWKITKSCCKNSNNIEHRVVKSESPYSPPSPPPLSRSYLCTIFLCICICSHNQHFITRLLIFYWSRIWVFHPIYLHLCFMTLCRSVVSFKAKQGYAIIYLMVSPP